MNKKKLTRSKAEGVVEFNDCCDIKSLAYRWSVHMMPNSTLIRHVTFLAKPLQASADLTCPSLRLQ